VTLIIIGWIGLPPGDRNLLGSVS